jgi:hypothetical protein
VFDRESVTPTAVAILRDDSVHFIGIGDDVFVSRAHMRSPNLFLARFLHFLP